MLYKPFIGAEMSGSMGGIVASHNRGGQYFRSRVVPTDPGSPFQQEMRGFMALLTSHWNNNLTQGQRDGWTTYSDNVPLSNRLGESKPVGGLAQFVRTNTVVLQNGGEIIEDAPGVFNLGEFTNPEVVGLDLPNQELDLGFVDTDAWANEDDSFMVAWIGRPQNPTINFFKGPYRYAGAVPGDAVTPPTSPAAIPLPFTVAAGQRVFGYVRVLRADGRVSSQFRFLAEPA